MKRRSFLITLAGASMLTFGGLEFAAFAASTPEELLQPGPLTEMSFGSSEAPVVVIEYASLTCGHCRNFHVNVWPAFKEKYVDTGKVRFIMREFPFDPRATAGFMLARCSGDDKWYPVVDLLYRSQDKWARVADATAALKSLMGMTGMKGADVEACLQDQTLLQKITSIAERGKSLGVDSTPTFFVNGAMYRGVLELDRFSEIVDPLLGGAK